MPAQPDADRAKKRPVYTTKKKKLAVTQQDTELTAGDSHIVNVAFDLSQFYAECVKFHSVMQDKLRSQSPVHLF